MKLRTKTFIIITAVFIGAFSIMAVLLSFFINNGNTKQEIQLASNDVNRANNIVDNSIAEVNGLVSDQAKWDDTYQFVQDKNQKFIDSNYSFSTFFDNHLNLVVILDIKGNILFSKYYVWGPTESGSSESDSLIETPIPATLAAFLTPGSRLLSSTNSISGTSGLISLSDFPLMVASHSITTSQGNGPIRGTIIFGRALDSVELNRLFKAYNLKIYGFRVDDPQIPPDFAKARSALNSGSPSFVQILNDNFVAGYFLRTDINEHSAFILGTETNRIFYSQSRSEVLYFSIALIIFGLIFILLILLILDRLVISRIFNLSQDVNQIGKSTDLSARVSPQGDDELGSLATNINGMLENLESSRLLQKEGEAFNSALLQDSPNPIEVTNLDGSLRYVNPALEKITGYTEAQLINRKPPFPWWTKDDTQQYTSELRELSAGGLQKLEKHFQKPDGEPFWVEITSTAILQNSQVKYYISNWVDITERKQADEALRQSENRFRELAELLPELVFETDLSGRITFVNRVAFRVFGYLTEDYDRLKLTDLIASENRSQAEKHLRSTIAGEETGNTEYIAIRKDATRFPVFIHATQVRNNLSEIVGLRGILVDITSQKEIESELRASEEFSSSLLDNAPNPIIVSNVDTSVRYINPALERLTGFSSLEVIGKSAPHPWWTEFNGDIIKQFKDSQIEATITERRFCKKNGELFWVTITNNPFIENGEVQYYVGNWVDITERKKTEDALRESEEFSSSLRDNSPYPIMVINSDTSIRYVNTALEKLSGFRSQDLVGTRLPYPFMPDNLNEINPSLNAQSIISNFKTEAVFQKKNGEEFHIDLNFTPIMKGPEVNYVLCIWIDITAQKLANEQLKQLYEREKAIREELQVEIRSRTEFTRALVHELKTPLTPIMASSELLVEELSEEPLLGLARNVHRGAENMNRRVDEMLDLARGEVGMLRVNINPVDPLRLLSEVVKYMEPQARNSGQNLELVSATNLPIVLADDERVRQILFNLIGNSIKYSNFGGQIKVSARHEGQELLVEVQDTGRGMSVEDQEKLFQPYYRVEGREHLSGLGLGLALSKKLVELQKGRIWVVSKKGEGSIFTFSLPIKTESTH